MHASHNGKCIRTTQLNLLRGSEVLDRNCARKSKLFGPSVKVLARTQTFTY